MGLDLGLLIYVHLSRTNPTVNLMVRMCLDPMRDLETD